jgi:hypothetical protein
MMALPGGDAIKASRRNATSSSRSVAPMTITVQLPEFAISLAVIDPSRSGKAWPLN